MAYTTSNRRAAAKLGLYRQNVRLENIVKQIQAIKIELANLEELEVYMPFQKMVSDDSQINVLVKLNDDKVLGALKKMVRSGSFKKEAQEELLAKLYALNEPTIDTNNIGAAKDKYIKALRKNAVGGRIQLANLISELSNDEFLLYDELLGVLYSFNMNEFLGSEELAQLAVEYAKNNTRTAALNDIIPKITEYLANVKQEFEKRKAVDSGAIMESLAADKAMKILARKLRNKRRK